MCRDQVGQASGKSSMSMIDFASSFAYNAVELVWVDVGRACSLRRADVGARS